MQICVAKSASAFASAGLTRHSAAKKAWFQNFWIFISGQDVLWVLFIANIVLLSRKVGAQLGEAPAHSMISSVLAMFDALGVATLR